MEAPAPPSPVGFFIRQCGTSEVKGCTVTQLVRSASLLRELFTRFDTGHSLRQILCGWLQQFQSGIASKPRPTILGLQNSHGKAPHADKQRTSNILCVIQSQLPGLRSSYETVWHRASVFEAKRRRNHISMRSLQSQYYENERSRLIVGGLQGAS
jgi:hypothetical protein